MLLFTLIQFSFTTIAADAATLQVKLLVTRTQVTH
jgi:hypothetical protein